MKILHTSDWHVGRTLRGHTRALEHVRALEEMAEIVAGEEVDLIVVAGNLFNSTVPTPQDEQIVRKALLDFSGTGARLVLLSGDHDNERFLQTVRSYAESARIFTSNELTSQLGDNAIEEQSRSGEQYRLALLPFLNQHQALKYAGASPGTPVEGRYAASIRQWLESCAQQFDSEAINVVAAHATVRGAIPGGGERGAQTGWEYEIEPEAFSPSIDYAALGHVHRSQRIEGPCPIWYCGSPLQLQFPSLNTGAGDPGVLLVELHKGQPADVRAVRIKATRNLATLEGNLRELANSASRISSDDFVQVFVKESPRPGLANEVRQILPEAVEVRLADRSDVAPITQTASSRAGKSPAELFAQYLSETEGTRENEVNLFARLLREANATNSA